MLGPQGSGPAPPEPPGIREALDRHVRALAGERHPASSPGALRRAADYVEERLRACGLRVEPHRFRFRGEAYRNVVGHLPGQVPGARRILVGAHYDTVRGTPGADDNASGVAVLLEVARILGTGAVGPDAEPGELPRRPVEFVAFALEEPQGTTFRVGSRRYVEDAPGEGRRYRGALILEMVGYTDPRAGSQRVPFLLRWKRVPETGTFLAAAGDWTSGPLLRTLREAADGLPSPPELVTTRVPFRGWPVPHTRLSDNASFWSAGVPALMLTDTAFLRNPHYHGPGDRPETLDLDFMASVTRLTAATARRLADGTRDPPGVYP